uniref:Mannose-6-phosphate isomerase 1-like n=1 Tax=Tanacetum cinerariifolium TaxID=118510 RepID=A0A6L2LN27_TANCI|nr:mannose-6-phosphate isomerase 1-like [Tanacetum cinerariifolium]
MLAPSGEGLILYQVYGNLFAMTGRKAHLLEDKQISSVGVFDKVFSIWKAFGGNTRDLGSFGEETNKTTDLLQHLSRISTQKLETTSQITRDAVTIHTKTVLENQLLSVSLLICLGKHDCVERIPSGFLHTFKPSVYKDTSYKPAVVLEATDVEALCGFISSEVLPKGVTLGANMSNFLLKLHLLRLELCVSGNGKIQDIKCENGRLGNGPTSWYVQAVQEMLSAAGVKMDVHIKSVTPPDDIVLARMIERITSSTFY